MPALGGGSYGPVRPGEHRDPVGCPGGLAHTDLLRYPAARLALSGRINAITGSPGNQPDNTTSTRAAAAVHRPRLRCSSRTPNPSPTCHSDCG
jgi:hypothetical protein